MDSINNKCTFFENINLENLSLGLQIIRMTKTPISAFIITLNEAHNIASCLERLAWCDEIVVVDSGSTDDTVAICTSFGAKVYTHAFEGFGAQKNYALACCSHPWRLSIDADELLDDRLISGIQAVQALPFEEAAAGYYLLRRQVFMGKAFKYGDESARKILRLVKKGAQFTNVKVHELLEVEGTKAVLSGILAHDSYQSFSHYLQTLNKYTSYNAEKAFLKGKNYSNFEVLVKPSIQFLRKYLLNLNFMNGVAGYYWSKLSAYYVFMKCLKVREYRERQSKP